MQVWLGQDASLVRPIYFAKSRTLAIRSLRALLEYPDDHTGLSVLWILCQGDVIHTLPYLSLLSPCVLHTLLASSHAGAILSALVVWRRGTTPYFYQTFGHTL